MNSEKLKKLLDIVNDKNKENSNSIIMILKDTFKRFVLGEEDQVELKSLWFEKSEIKEDSDYYKIICSYIDIFISNFQDIKSFNLGKFCEKLVAVSENNKYSIYYKLLLELYKRFDFDVDTELYYKIFCSLYCLGFRKESMINKYLIENLIDFSQEESIIKSGYDSCINDFNYDKIDEIFLKNFLNFFDLILKDKPDKKSIELQIKILKNKEICISQRSGSSSTSITNPGNIENELSTADNNGNTSSIENDINNEIVNNVNNNLFTDNSKNEETEIINKKESSSLVDKDIIQNDNLNDSFENIKKENFGMEKNFEKNLSQFILSFFQRQNRFNDIVQKIWNINNHINEYNQIQNSKKDLFLVLIKLEKSLITINKLKGVIETLKAPTIINMKRKIIDLIIYLIIKNNEDKFKLNPDYCPNQNFLKMILKKLNNIEHNDNIKNKIVFINNLISQNKTTIEFPISCTDIKINKIMQYLSFYKSNCNEIVHISNQQAKNYYIPFNQYIDKNIINLLQSEKNDKENELNSNNKIQTTNEEKIIDNEKDDDAFLDINLAFDFVFKSSNSLIDNSKLEKDIKILKLDESKNLSIDKISEVYSDMFNQISKLWSKKMEYKINNNIFTSKEQLWINNGVNKFNEKLKSVIQELYKLKEFDDDSNKVKEFSTRFSKEINALVKNELKFDIQYFGNLCETDEGRNLLVYFQYKLMKFNLLDNAIQDVIKILEKYFENKRNNILNIFNTIKIETEKMNEKIEKSVHLKSGIKIFREWKIKKSISLGNTSFDSFIFQIKDLIKSVKSIKLDEDIISDQVTSLWLIENKLDELVL